MSARNVTQREMQVLVIDELDQGRNPRRRSMKSRSGTFASSCLFGALTACLNAAAAADNASYLTPAQAIPHGTAPGARAQLLSDIDGRRTYALILARDDELFTALTDFVQRHAIKAAHFTAIGALRDLQLGWYDLDRKAYKVIPVPGQVEALAVIGHGRYAIFQMPEVAVPRELFGHILERIARLRPPDPLPC